MAKGSKKVIKSFIGFVYGGPYKVGIVHMFKDPDAGSVDEVHERMINKFGALISGRLIPTDDIDVHFDELLKQADKKDAKQGEHIYQLSVNPASELLKLVTGAKKLKHFSPHKDEDEEKEKPKKAAKEESDAETEEEEEAPAPKEEKKPKKKPAKKEETEDEEEAPAPKEEKKEEKKPKKKPVKKEESDDEEEAPAPKEEKKVAKKVVKKETPKKKVESDEEDDD